MFCFKSDLQSPLAASSLYINILNCHPEGSEGSHGTSRTFQILIRGPRKETNQRKGVRKINLHFPFARALAEERIFLFINPLRSLASLGMTGFMV
jgi:hypothetical protein